MCIRDSINNQETTYSLVNGNVVFDQSSNRAFQLQHTVPMKNGQTVIWGLDVLDRTPETKGTINGKNEDDDNFNNLGVYYSYEKKFSDKFKFVGTGRFDTNLVPSTDDERDLGTSTLEWKDLFLDGTAHVDTLDVDANAGIIGYLTVTGTSEFNNTVDVDADFAVRNGTTDKFFVDNLTGNTNIEGTLTADGHAELNSTLNVDSNTTLGGTLSVTNNASLSSNLTVNGNTTLGNANTDTVTIPGILDVNGRADIDNIRIDGNTISAQNSDGNVDINGNGSGHINLNDDVDVAGTLDVAGVFNANSTSNFAGDATFNGGAGAATIGANSDIRLVNGTWSGNVAGKIQHHNNFLYIQGGSSGHIFRTSNGSDAVDIDGNGNLAANYALTVTGLLDCNGGAHIDNLRLGIDEDGDCLLYTSDAADE